jgi:fructokinase
MSLYGAVEAGGTKFVCCVGTGPDDIRSEVTLTTEEPDKTLIQTINYFREYQKKHREQLKAVGIACFGPVDLREGSDKYGYITTTPKESWQDVDIVGVFKKLLKIPIGFDTDVNAAAYGEYLWGAGKGLDVVLYLTVGTGIGGGLYIHGKLVHGLLHPEMGHVIIKRNNKQDPFKGCCPYHKDCLEGLASGRAVELRWSMPPLRLPDDHPAWELEAEYLAQGLVDYILMVSPEKIILGGGLMHRHQLFPLIRKKVQVMLNGYLSVRAIQKDIENYIVSPGLGDKSGICGAIGLAMKILKEKGVKKS